MTLEQYLGNVFTGWAYKRALWLTRYNKQNAQDLLQEAVLNALRSRPSTPILHERGFDFWFSVVLSNTNAKLWQKQLKENTKRSKYRPESVVYNTGENRIDYLTATKEIRSRLNRHQWTVLSLTAAGYSNEEMGEALGSYQYVKQSACTARKKIRDLNPFAAVN